MLKHIIACSCLISCISHAFAQKKYTLSSPDKTIVINLSITDSITYAVSLDGKELMTTAPITFHTTADKNAQWKVSKAQITAKDEILKPVVQQKSAELHDHYNQLHIDFSNGLSLEWRAYNNGIAWHWIANHKTAYTVLNEQALFGMDADGRAWYPQEESFFSHNERQYKNYRIDSIDEKKLASLPALFDVKGAKLLITEADLFNYAGLWLRGKGNGQVQGVFPHYPKEKKITSDRDERVNSREDFIARISGPQAFPWRIVMIARTDKDMLTNQLPYQLGRPATGDYSWVKPGKVQWDWWHYNNVYGVNFRAGINNDTYKYYIDFAAKYGIEYVLLDEGWCDTRDLLKQSPGINVEELVAYARARKVDILLWTSWLVLDKQLDTILPLFQQWGIKGIKVDFMQRDDQDMVNYYEKVSKAAAAHHLLVDFHGAYKPTGWLRTYPNVMTSEGVLGNEISKFAGSIDPEHTTTIPFTRMAAGPMDFTPGGMLNAQKNAWAAVPGEPLTLGTRCNQLAMYVIYESPLQMLCDMPTHYYREPEAMEFLQAVPAVWTNTVPLQAKVGDYVAIARQAANGDWFVGAMTDWTPRELELDCSFLPEGQYRMQVWKDGPNADRNAKDFSQETITVTNTTKLTMPLTKGGGYVARLTRL
ncbi:glycoside hydrolase family 97 protein [Pseudoflavitalea sp. X16]|uniref:glycoside hydrolase family 97 protein n=1 Tax=Paraflavitalea devenefica TaxID=2716334 RepID=UPI0014221BFD|nr:glycoside hydrolase family 97 protein [Paraflavitalea devenefica]NII27784.1 glycoside hydrolase family 97 protein [Paraflavitalea devenefica]